jgi:hypothetical protein
MNIKQKEFNITKLPKIYQRFMPTYFREANFTDNPNATHIRMCEIPDEDTIALDSFYSQYCELSEFQPDEKEYNRLFRQLTCKDPAERRLAEHVIFGLSNKHTTLKKCLALTYNFLDIENVDSEYVFVIKMINNALSTPEVSEPMDELRVASEADVFNTKELVEKFTEIYNEKYASNS